MTPPTVTVDATGRRETRPELATVEVTAVGDGESASAACERARDRAETIRSSLAAADVPGDRVRTVDFRVEETAELFEPDTDAPYRATARLCVDCAPATASDVVVAAADADGTVRGVDFGVHEETRRELRDEALAAATDRARGKAERVAGVEDLAVAGVRELSTREVSAGMESIVDDALAGSPDVDFNPSPVVVEAAVEVTYDLDGD